MVKAHEDFKEHYAECLAEVKSLPLPLWIMSMNALIYFIFQNRVLEVNRSFETLLNNLLNFICPCLIMSGWYCCWIISRKSVKVSCTSLFDLNYLLLPSCFLYSVANEQNIIYAVLLIMSLVCIYSTDRNNTVRKKGCQYPELRKVIYVITGIVSYAHRFFHFILLSLLFVALLHKRITLFSQCSNFLLFPTTSLVNY